MKQTQNDFFARMNLPDAKPIQEMLSHFILEEFPNMQNVCINEQAKRIQDKITELTVIYGKTFKIDIDKDEEAYCDICNGFESVITKRLYNRIFCATSEEKIVDYEFNKQTELFSFIKPCHLEIDVSAIQEIYLVTAINKLSMINHYKSPKDKISTLINFCNIISAMLSKKTKSVNDNKYAGADEVMPVVVYTLLRGNIPKIKSNLKYIRLFRHHSMFDANKEEYFTTMIESAVEFIDKLNVKSDLKIEKKEFEELIKQKEEEMLHKKIIEPIQQETKNADENFLVYFLTETTKSTDEISSLSNIKDDPIELNEFKTNAVQINTSSTISKELMKDKNGLMNIDLDKLYDEYFTKDLKEMPVGKIEKMVNDFKITLALLDNYSKVHYENTQPLEQSNNNMNAFDNSKNVIN